MLKLPGRDYLCNLHANLFQNDNRLNHIVKWPSHARWLDYGCPKKFLFDNFFVVVVSF